MKMLLARVLMLPTALCLFIGCDQSQNANPLKNYRQPPDTDVSSLPEFNFTSFAGSVWRTKAKVALADVKAYNGEWHASLLVSKHYDQSDPDYTPGSDQHVITVLPVGTRLQIKKLMKDNGVWGGVRVIAAVDDAADSQKIVVLDKALIADNQFISPGVSSFTNWALNPNMLEK